MWNLVSIRLETVLVLVHDLRPLVLWSQKSFWTHPMVHLGDDAQVEACFSLFGDSANLEAR